MSIRILLATAASTAFAACATSGPPAISNEEVFAFERALLARESPTPEPLEKLFIQPANKVEACKLPTSQEQLDRTNFRAYWDGECKNGFAFGLGRDIAISDTHHIEEITVHDGTGDNWSKPKVLYDYVNSQVSYQIGGSRIPVQTFLEEKIDNSIKGFNAQQTLSVMDDLGNAFAIRTYSFHPQRDYVLSKNFGTLTYKFSDLSAVPTTDPNAQIFTAVVVDPLSSVGQGFGFSKVASGPIPHFKIDSGVYELVSLPESYVSHLWAKYQEILTVSSAASARLQTAQQIERKYLFKACDGKSGVDGLDNATYTKICTWREQFKEPYAIALANYQRQLETLRQQAATADQQRQIQQQIALQQEMLRQQQDQQVWNRLNQTTQQLQQQTDQILGGITNRQAPQVQQPTTSSGETVVCNAVGSIVICR